MLDWIWILALPLVALFADGGGSGDSGGEGDGEGDPAGGDPAAGDPAAAAVAAATAWTGQIEALPEEIRGADALKKTKNFEDLATQFVKQQPLIGRDKVLIPGKAAKPEEWAKFHQQLGAPEKAEGYELPTKGLPEKHEPNEALTKSFRDEAHKLGITKGQFAGLYRWQVNAISTRQAELDKEAEQWVAKQEDEAKTKYGDALQEKKDLADDAIDYYDDEEGSMRKMLVETGLIHDMRAFNFYVKLGESLDDDQIKGTGGAQRRMGAKTPVEAQADLDALSLDKEHQEAKHKEEHVGHAAAIERERLLYVILNPEPTTQR